MLLIADPGPAPQAGGGAQQRSRFGARHVMDSKIKLGWISCGR